MTRRQNLWSNQPGQGSPGTVRTASPGRWVGGSPGTGNGRGQGVRKALAKEKWRGPGLVSSQKGILQRKHTALWEYICSVGKDEVLLGGSVEEGRTERALLAGKGAFERTLRRTELLGNLKNGSTLVGEIKDFGNTRNSR